MVAIESSLGETSQRAFDLFRLAVIGEVHSSLCKFRPTASHFFAQKRANLRCFSELRRLLKTESWEAPALLGTVLGYFGLYSAHRRFFHNLRRIPIALNPASIPRLGEIVVW